MKLNTKQQLGKVCNIPLHQPEETYQSFIYTDSIGISFN